MRLVDPTGTVPELNHTRATKPEGLEGKVVGLLSNGKLNADLLLTETAKLFAKRHGCQIGKIVYKANPSAPAPEETLKRVAAESDFMLTATGD